MLIPDWRFLLSTTSSPSITDSIVIERVVVLLMSSRFSEVFLPLSSLFFHAHDVQHMAKVDESGRRDKDDLQHPKTDMGDGEGLVIADVLATGLLGVTGEVRLFVTPNFFSGCAKNQDTENE